MPTCLFCQLIKKEIPAKIVYEDKKFIAFNDINPISPIHILIVPKKHTISINHLNSRDKNLMGELFLIAKKVAKNKKLTKSGYRLIINVGKNAGQTIPHIHLHLLGGKRLPWH